MVKFIALNVPNGTPRVMPDGFVYSFFTNKPVNVINERHIAYLRSYPERFEEVGVKKIVKDTVEKVTKAVKKTTKKKSTKKKK